MMGIFRNNDRAAAEMVGVLMLIAIFVAVIAIIAVVLFSSPPPDKNPAVNLRITNESGLIKLLHAGGDALENDKLRIYVDGTLRSFDGFGPEGTWSTGEVLTYTLPPPDMPNKIDIVYGESLWRGTNAALIATLFLGNMTTVNQDVSLYTIMASSNSGGSISPSGTLFLSPGESVSFTITADPLFTIADVVVDGVSVGPETEYTFSAIDSSHTIRAVFASSGLSLFRINATAGEGGTISPGNVTVAFGADQTFIITSNPNYVVGSVVVNGTPQIPVPASYTFTNITANHTIDVSFTSNFTKGVIANYYLGQTWSVPAATNIAPRIRFADIASGYASDIVGWPTGYIGRADNFSVNFTGYVKIDTTDDYTFYLTSDDGSWLYLNGTQIINNGGLHSPTMVQQTVRLTPGYHPIFVPMFENTGQAVAWLEYSSPNITRTFDVPLYHTAIFPPSVDFTGAPLAGTAPHTVQYTDASIGATTWVWDFGDGSPPSYEQNPAHTYTTTGRYNVTLVGANSYGVNTKTRLNYVTVANSYSPGWIGTYFPNELWTDPGVSRIDPRIRFADSASGETTDEANWPVGSGTLPSAESFSVHWEGYLRVNTSDMYTFSLRSDDGSWLWIRGDQIIDNGGLHAATTVTGSVFLDPGYHHIVVRMYEHTGSAVARLQYASPNMTIRDVSDVWHVPFVAPPVAAFTATPESGSAPLVVTFTDTSTNSPTSWLWDFGDGTSSTTQNPVHTYSADGSYTATLTAQNSGGSSLATRTITVVTPVSMSILLNSNKASHLVSGGTLQFRVTGSSGSSITHGTTSYTLNSGDIVQLALTGDSVGTAYVTTTMISPITLSNVRLVINGIDHGVNSMTASVGAYDQFSSTLNIDVPFSDTDLWTQFAKDGTNLINGGNRSRIQVFGIKPLPGTAMNFEISPTRVYYVGGATGYLITTYDYPAPTVTSIDPTSHIRGSTVWPTLAGTGFRDGATVSLVRNGSSTTFTASPVYVTSSTSLNCAIDLSTAPTGTYDVRVTNTDGKSGILTNGFTVKNPTAQAWSISPNSGARGWTTGTLTITGMNFVSGATVRLVNPALGPDIIAENVVVTSSSGISCRFNLLGQPAGTWNVLVSNPDSDPGSAFSGFTITSPAPSISGSAPAYGAQGASVPITNLAGSGFQPGATVSYTRGGYSIPLTPVTVISPTTITGTLPVPPAAPLGLYSVTVTNTDGKSSTFANGITVLPPLVADFTFVEQGNSGKVTFTDASTGGPTSWSWDFGNSQTSTLQNPPQINYAKWLSYTVTLTVTRNLDGATSTAIKTVTV
jgi:PKD repeat protein